MWQNFSLRARINLLLALVLTLGLAANIARLVLEAGPRVQAEDQSVIRLAREFIDTIVAGLSDLAFEQVRLIRKHWRLKAFHAGEGFARLLFSFGRVSHLQSDTRQQQVRKHSFPSER